MLAPTRQAPERAEEAEMPDRVADLGAVVRFEVRQQVHVTAAVGAVVDAAKRHDARRVVAPAERARDQVGRVDGTPSAADDAR
jgi:hypothetical protein